ncbi:MAG TPA: WD40 repeat domain-containing protein [Cyanobacteria bacterium UBA11369]|nr:WD40 repeat domain-containing protein [Cyanobacteria bacterium UBA11371]HBE30307.1 WD40 repeat domain-containing protein [Cyanobacteria bacterium UBA11368]HBE49506.1 WD40 repeat domain-containing protein [Cyanobacteria bacterium UBA11369]
MSQNTQEPRDYDVVLGGHNIIPATGVVLGGIAGVKRRFASAIAEHRVAAVKEAKKYGKAGLEIGIKALQDESELVQKTAYLQLRERKEEEVRQALRQFNYYRFFECLRTVKAGEQIALNSTGEKAAFLASNRTIKVVDLNAMELLYAIPKYPRNQQYFIISDDGEVLVRSIKAAKSFVEIWVGGELEHTLYGHQGEIRAIALSPDAKFLATGGDDRCIKIWDISSGKLILNISPLLMWGTHKESIIRLAFSPDGKTLVSSDVSRSIKLWNWQNRSEPQTLNMVGYSLAISPDGQMLATGCFKGIITILTLDGKIVQTLNPDSHLLHYLFRCIAFSPDGKTIVVGDGYQKSIDFWNIKTGKLIRSFTGEDISPDCLAFSWDGQSLIAGSNDKTIKIWGI